jgi:hypothetical protein
MKWNRSGLVEIATLGVILAGAAAVRLYRLDALPWGSVEGEDGTVWFAVAGFLDHGRPILPSGLHFWKGFPYTVLCAIPSGLLGLSKWSLRLPSALAGIALVPAAWWLARRTLAGLRFDRWMIAPLALFAAYCVGYSQWLVLMSRTARFYSLGSLIYTLAVIAALRTVCGREEGTPATSRTADVVSLALATALAAATFHPGGLLLLALPAFLVMGVPLGRREWMILCGGVLLTTLWYAAVLFLWQTGHVTSETGAGDLANATEWPFWRDVLVIGVGSLGAWALLARAGSGRMARGFSVAILTVLSVLLVLAALLQNSPRGALRAFGSLSSGQPQLMVIAIAGILLLPLRAVILPREGRWTAGILWCLLVISVGIVAADTAHYALRYQIFAAGPLAVLASVALASLVSIVPSGPGRLLLGILILASVGYAMPSIGPVPAYRITMQEPGEPLPEPLRAGIGRKVAFDLESAARFVASGRAPGDVVIGTQCCIPPAFLGHIDYLYCAVDRSDIWFVDDQGTRRSLLDGSRVLSRPEEVLELGRTKRVHVLLVPWDTSGWVVTPLRQALIERTGQPAYVAARGTAEVYTFGPLEPGESESWRQPDS